MFTGDHVKAALEDDYVEIGARKTPEKMKKLLIAGGIISFANVEKWILHTGVVVNVPVSLPGTEVNVLNRVEVNSKNGTNLEFVQSIFDLCGVYPDTQKMRFWRDKLTCFDDTMQQ